MLDTKDVTIVVMGGLLKMRLEGLAFNGVSFVTLEMFVCLIHTLWWIRVCIWATILWAYHNGWTIHYHKKASCYSWSQGCTKRGQS
jgi:hypothetical protein